MLTGIYIYIYIYIYICIYNKVNTHFIFNLRFYKNHTFYEIMWKSIVQTDMPHKKIRGMRIACWISKAINTHSVYILFIGSPLAQWFLESSTSLKMHILPGRYLLLSDPKSLVRQDTFLQEDPPRDFSAD